MSEWIIRIKYMIQLCELHNMLKSSNADLLLCGVPHGHTIVSVVRIQANADRELDHCALSITWASGIQATPQSAELLAIISCQCTERSRLRTFWNIGRAIATCIARREAGPTIKSCNLRRDLIIILARGLLVMRFAWDRCRWCGSWRHWCWWRCWWKRRWRRRNWCRDGCIGRITTSATVALHSCATFLQHATLEFTLVVQSVADRSDASCALREICGAFCIRELAAGRAHDSSIDNLAQNFILLARRHAIMSSADRCWCWRDRRWCWRRRCRRRWRRSWCWWGPTIHLGERRLRLDATDVASGADFQVTIVAPGRPPRILDLEVASRAVITHCQHTVIKVGSTST